LTFPRRGKLYSAFKKPGNFSMSTSLSGFH
jgi:hypothetical protein